MNLKALRQRDADLRAALATKTREKATIGETAVREKRAMSDDERAAFLAFTPQIDALHAQIDENKELLEAAEAANEAERNYRSGPVADADADAARAAAAASGQRRIEVVDPATRPGFFGRQLQAVRNAALALKGGDGLSGSDRDVLATMQAAATGMNSDVPSEGGFLVAQTRSAAVLQRAYETGAIMSRVNRMPIGPGSNGMLLPAIDETSRADSSRFGGIVSGWLGQGNSLTSGKPKFRLLDMKLRKVGAFCYATDELIADAVALEAWISMNLPKELAFRAEDAFVNGIGANQPLGILNGGAVITATRSLAAHVQSADLQTMWARLWAPLRAGAVWLVDQSVEPELDVLGVPVGTGGYADPSYKAAGSVPGQIYATYKGAPIIPVEYCAALGTTGDIILTNFSEYAVIDKGGVEQAVSLHVAFLTDEAVFRFIYRVDGQPTWNAALTPKSAGNTLSPIVVLS